VNLRPYQTTVLDELWAWFNRAPEGNPIVEAAVGAGKSLMIAALAQRADREFPGTRVLVIVHQKELLDQNLQKLLSVWPMADVGVYSASHGRKQLGCQITYATIGSIYKRALDIGRVDIVLADECHLINPKDTGMWRHFLKELSRTCPHARTIGWTGTPYRGNGVWLTAHEDALFTEIATRITMRQLLDLGYLSPLVPAQTNTRIDTSDVRTSGDDFVISDLARAADQENIVQAAADEIVAIGQDRRRWLVFAVTVEHATHVAQALRDRDVAAEVVSAKTPKAERERLIAQFRAGKIRCLVNVAVLTTGVDVPEVDFIALLRATKSPVLYVQIAGRGMRLADHKTNCVFADFTDTVERLGPVDAIKGRNPSQKGSGEAPFKLCENCGSRCAAGASSCPNCGFEFPPPERIKHGDKASQAPVMSDQKSPFDIIEIDDVEYRRHTKPGAPDSIRVDYRSGIMTVASEWVCPSHVGFARRKFENWWLNRQLIDALPSTTDEALEWLEYDKGILKKPVAIVTTKNGRYREVVSHHWVKQQ
jgi:DNA repair protein RadD